MEDFLMIDIFCYFFQAVIYGVMAILTVKIKTSDKKTNKTLFCISLSLLLACVVSVLIVVVKLILLFI
jgi:hypothetical protein